MSDFTPETIEMFRALAGDSFDWDRDRTRAAGLASGARPPASYLGRKGFRAILRADILARQGGLCPVCGDEAVAPEFNHAVSRGPSVKGFHPLCVFVGCATCNTMCERTYGAVIPFEAYARPDVIASEWTPFPVLARS